MIHRHFPALLALLCLLPLSSDAAALPQEKPFLEAARTFADKVLREAGDRYHTPASPLLANAVDVETGQPLRWVHPKAAETILSDFALEQNFMRVLVALSRLTGDPSYRAAAEANYRYYFAHYQTPGGLLIWGGHRYVDLLTLEPRGMNAAGEGPHELKNAFPFYEFMYEVNPEATRRFITGFWNAHVFDWHNLEVSRHGEWTLPPGTHWEEPYNNPAPYRETTGLSFLDAGNDLIYSAAMLHRLSGDPGALVWARRLASQYVRARNPDTGLGAYQFTQPRRTREPIADEDTLSMYGDRAQRQFGPEFPGHLVLEATMLLRGQAMTLYAENALMQLQIGQTLGKNGTDFLEWTRSGMVAFARRGVLPGSDYLRPMITDGTDLSGFEMRRDGYYGKKGTRIEPYKATPELLLSYARGFLLTRDTELWRMARLIAQNANLGDIGDEPGKEPHLNLSTHCDDPQALFALLDLYRETKCTDYLSLSAVIGENILAQRTRNGWFMRKKSQQYASIDAIEPYALLALVANLRGTPEAVPEFINGGGFYSGVYQFPDGSSRQINWDELLGKKR